MNKYIVIFTQEELKNLKQILTEMVLDIYNNEELGNQIDDIQEACKNAQKTNT